MGVSTHNDEFTSTVAPARLFKAAVLDADNLFPKIAPDAAKSAENIEGNGGPGTIKKITFPDGKYVKQKLDAIDHDNYSYSHSIIEGDVLSADIEKISHETKFVAAPGGGSVIKVTTTFHTVGSAPVDEAKAKEGKEKAAGLFKLVEGYLEANPSAYN
ncbi:major allergen Pru av 1-like [Morus notabilis]|uniref:major allergen Pru av 1-like n=1 Tax=Morus notabilis TaxID=981085 RepID=UPI000CED316F|nr:major allergen Pru av 1-like [Morus notabilis]XP_024027257.1 major allergen Pru av 1-like [Morus notabilis]